MLIYICMMWWYVKNYTGARYNYISCMEAYKNYKNYTSVVLRIIKPKETIWMRMQTMGKPWGNPLKTTGKHHMKTIGISWEYHRKTTGIHRETNFHPRDTIVTPEIQSRKTKWPPRDATSWCKMSLWFYSYNSMCLLIVYSYKFCGWPPLPHSVWMVVLW